MFTRARQSRDARADLRRRHSDRLAALLADDNGVDILDELQSLHRRLGELDGREAPWSRTRGDEVGAWRVRGPEMVRRDDVPDIRLWADIDHVDLDDTRRRVVLIGESVARGWVYDPRFNPAVALRRQLDLAAPGLYQVVDLAKSGVRLEELTYLVGQLPLIRPDVLVVFAGNNWMLPPPVPEPGLRGVLSEALLSGGFARLRGEFVDAVLLPAARSFMASVHSLHADHGTEVVVVVPESNLGGWSKPTGLDVTVLPTDRLRNWYQLRSEADEAVAAGRTADAVALAERMRQLDGDTSPVPGAVRARVATRLGDPGAARTGLERARDSLHGIGMMAYSQTTRTCQNLLAEFAVENGFRCVDLRAVLAEGPLALPDPLAFLDHCHLADGAIERAVARIADALLGLPLGTRLPGPGASRGDRLAARVVAIALHAQWGQPSESIALQARAAIACDPRGTELLDALLDLLESGGPAWAHAAVEPLSEVLDRRVLCGVRRSQWSLRAGLGAALGRSPVPVEFPADLLEGAEMDQQWLAGDDPAERCYVRSRSELTVLRFALGMPRSARLRLTYRIRHGQPGRYAIVSVNDHPIGTLQVTAGWSQTDVAVPVTSVRTGTNEICVRWPFPAIDSAVFMARDAARIARGTYPGVLPEFGELWTAVLDVLGPLGESTAATIRDPVGGGLDGRRPG